MTGKKMETEGWEGRRVHEHVHQSRWADHSELSSEHRKEGHCITAVDTG